MAVITISREYGSGGDAAARRVAEILGYGYFDRSMLLAAIRQVRPAPGSAPEHETEPSWLDRLLGTQQVVWDVIEARAEAEGAGLEAASLDEPRSLPLIRQAVEAAYSRGNVVILGRSAQVILQDRAGVLCVRIAAPLPLRAANVAQQEHLSLDEAEAKAVEQDRATAQYLRDLYGVDWDDPLLYHMLLNAGRWDSESAAQIIAAAAGRLPAG